MARLVAASLLMLALAGGCNRGRDRVILGQAVEANVCMPGPLPISTTSACPACSAVDEAGRCRDVHYGTAVHCVGDADCGSAATCDSGLCVFRDEDHDGIDDDYAREVAERNLPAIHLHPGDRCPGPRGIVYRVRRHPDAPSRLAVTYVVLYEADCGPLNGHLGDDEAFAITVDPSARPGAAAIVGIRTDAHHGTACGSVSSCETAPGTSACAPVGSDHAVVYASRDKHASYLDVDLCHANCFDQCAAGPVDASPTLVDVGQPDAPLVHDLTALAGALPVGASGWDPKLLAYDPWSSGTFGGAGHVRAQLLDLIAPPGLQPVPVAPLVAEGPPTP